MHVVKPVSTDQLASKTMAAEAHTHRRIGLGDATAHSTKETGHTRADARTGRLHLDL
jgi:hypothetical protein